MADSFDTPAFNTPLLKFAHVRLFALSFTALFLELMVIRWVPARVRLIAYYANLMLISSFLGLGVGAMLSNRKWDLGRLFPVFMLALVGFVLIYSGEAISGSSGEARFFKDSAHLYGYAALIIIFLLNTLMFVPIGEQIGRLFSQLLPLRAYAWDLAGSLVGTVVFGLFSIRFFSPLVGFAVVVAIYCMVMPRGLLPLNAGLGGAVVLLLILSANPGAVWSPYHYLTVHDPWGRQVFEPEAGHRTKMDPLPYVVRVNQDIYQAHTTLNPARYTDGSPPAVMNRYNTVQYPLPYRVKSDAKDVLVLGAGGGLDVEAALLAGATSVDAVEIDPAIVRISHRFSPSDIYQDPRVHIHIEDARAYLQRASAKYDAVIFGFLDSQNLFSYGSNLRLDGYIYTVECFRQAFSLLKDDGILSVSFSVPETWVAEKLAKMLNQATGVVPVIYQFQKQYVLLVPRFSTDAIPSAQQMYQRLDPAPMLQASRAVATDNWPYLYLQKPAVPMDYCLVIGALIVISAGTVIALRQTIRVDAEDGHFFFLGIGFLLLQTKGIGDCSLYFGTTWVVSLIVISGTLLMVLLANALAMRMHRELTGWAYLPVFGAVILLAFMPRSLILGLPMAGRLAWALLVVPLPIFFAGLIFSTTFRRAANPSLCFGANLVGATIGGFCEYLGMWIGTNALSYFILAAYLASSVCLYFKPRIPTPVSAASS
ncbi:MAG TPA: hypothetical protein VHD56_16585 [Tepidisphaeraceae bacterium]|nr:hypothetical protein [Tepidisphaeraceae bacterium]